MPSSLKISSLSLSNAISEHNLKEKASFHTPGHKGFAWQSDGNFSADIKLKVDLTELPGLDELAYPKGVILDLEKRAANVWGTQSTLISVNGATAGVIASIIMLVKHGTHLLVPRNCHRSVINALTISGLEPIWFELNWEAQWNIWGAPNIQELSKLLKTISEKIASFTKPAKIAGILITSPTCAGALADIQLLSKLADTYKIPLIVDEANGAHLNWSENSKQAALNTGASMVIHSLHKTLSCPTQTGLVHISKKGAQEYDFSESELRACLNLIQSSSPSYFFMDAIDRLVNAFDNSRAQEQIEKLDRLGKRLKAFVDKTEDLVLYKSADGNIASDILVKHKYLDSLFLQNFLIERGLFPEALIGQGLLFLLGMGSQAADIDKLEVALLEIKQNSGMLKQTVFHAHPKPKPIDQVIGPRKAFFMPSYLVPTKEAIGQISAECLAPCPPGWPILVPGERINEDLLSFENIKSVRILKTNSQFNIV